MAGLLGLSCAWILLFATLHLATAGVRQQARQRSRISPSSSKAEEGKESEADLLHSLGPDSLPSWVTFPDVDRAEWINVILRKLWPKFGDIGNQIVKLLVEPKINEIMKRLSIKGLNLETLSAFKIKQLVLGSIPARVQGIRVYERNTARDELVLDVEVMYAGDLRVKFALQGLDCEINQVTFRGTIRIVLKPLMSTMPVVGGLEFYFLSLPTLDFNLGGMAAAGDLPGISSIVRSIIDFILRRGFVWPNRFRMFLPMKVLYCRFELNICQHEYVTNVKCNRKWRVQRQPVSRWQHLRFSKHNKTLDMFPLRQKPKLHESKNCNPDKKL